MTIDHAHAYWVTAPGQGALRKETLSPPGPGEVLVRTLYSGISRGSEALVFRGEVPVSEYARMRAPFQAGDFPAPVKYGYISVGVVEQGPPPLAGRTVFCLYPHQDRYVVAADAVHPLPDNVPAGRAVLAANLETAVNALWDSAARIGDRITVIGAGTLGCLIAWLAGRIPGCSVELVDVNPDRAQVAARLGVAFALPRQAAAEADRVIHTSGTAEGLARALELGAFEATVTELSWYGSRLVPLPLGAEFHARRLSIRSSQVGAIATSQRSRWDPRRRMQLVLQLLGEGVLDTLITGESAFADLPAVMPDLVARPGQILCHRIVYE
jgi:threonine dehydrogenase-like Zn-dependent dehydrogenase